MPGAGGDAVSAVLLPSTPVSSICLTLNVCIVSPCDAAAEMEHASRRQRRRRTTLQLMARNSSSDLSSDEGGSDEEGEQEMEVQGKLDQEQHPLMAEAAVA